jgi:hypothetical protein
MRTVVGKNSVGSEDTNLIQSKRRRTSPGAKRNSGGCRGRPV